MTPNPQPPAWAILEQALIERRPVQATYHGHQRLLCPHTLGWRNNRPKVLAYQADGTTSQGTLTPNPHQRWRSMFIDEIQNATITNHPWQTADNYTPTTNGIDTIHLHITPTT